MLVKKDEPSPQECLQDLVNRLRENPFTDISWFALPSSNSVDTSVDNAL